MLGRRLDRANAVAKRLFNIYYDNFGDTFTPHMSEESKKRALGIFRKTRTPCSCWMCGNPRRHGGGKTLAERADADSAADQVRDYFWTLSEEKGVSGREIKPCRRRDLN